MKPLAHITDVSLGIAETQPDTPDHRNTARIIIFDEENKIVLLNVGRRGFHKLPGGGADPGETWEETAIREALEETGLEVRLRGAAIAEITEQRGQLGVAQTSRCFLADIVRDTGALKREDDEVEDEQLPVRVTLDEAIDMISREQNPEDYEGKFIVVRELAFLKAAKKIV